jgi:hypothetical protein
MTREQLVQTPLKATCKHLNNLVPPLIGVQNRNAYVEVSGETVIPFSPGNYHLIYECENSHGVKADPLTRLVVVTGTLSLSVLLANLMCV